MRRKRGGDALDIGHIALRTFQPATAPEAAPIGIIQRLRHDEPALRDVDEVTRGQVAPAEGLLGGELRDLLLWAGGGDFRLLECRISTCNVMGI